MTKKIKKAPKLMKLGGTTYKRTKRPSWLPKGYIYYKKVRKK